MGSIQSGELSQAEVTRSRVGPCHSLWAGPGRASQTTRALSATPVTSRGPRTVSRSCQQKVPVLTMPTGSLATSTHIRGVTVGQCAREASSTDHPMAFGHSGPASEYWGPSAVCTQGTVVQGTLGTPAGATRSEGGGHFLTRELPVPMNKPAVVCSHTETCRLPHSVGTCCRWRGSSS